MGAKCNLGLGSDNLVVRCPCFVFSGISPIVQGEFDESFGENTVGKENAQTAAPRRRSMHPHAGDTWASIAERELSEQPQEAAVAQLQSWNLHVFARRIIDDATGEMGNPILPSDILFLEPPLAASQS